MDFSLVSRMCVSLKLLCPEFSEYIVASRMVFPAQKFHFLNYRVPCVEFGFSFITPVTIRVEDTFCFVLCWEAESAIGVEQE